MKDLILEIPEIMYCSEIMEIAELVPKLTSLHLKTEGLGFGDELGESEFPDKIQSLKLRRPYGYHDYILSAVVEDLEIFKNLTHLHLGEAFPIFEAAVELSDENLIFFSKLQDIKGLKSLKLHLEFPDLNCGRRFLQFFQQINLPVGLEIFGFGLLGIPTNETSDFKVEEFSPFFEKIKSLKDLRALHFWFGFAATDPPNASDKQFLDTFMSLLPHNLSKLEVLSTKIRIGKKNESRYGPRFLWEGTYLNFGKILSPDKVFEWVQSHPRVRNVQLEIPMMSNFELEKKTLFDNEMQFLEHLSLSISHQKFEVKDCFEDLLARLSEQRGLKCLTLKIKNSFNYAKTVQIMEKYLSAMMRLESLRIKLREYPSKIGIEKLSGLKPLIQKVRFVSLSVRCDYSDWSNEKVISAMRTIFTDEIRKKGKLFEVQVVSNYSDEIFQIN